MYISEVLMYIQSYKNDSEMFQQLSWTRYNILVPTPNVIVLSLCMQCRLVPGHSTMYPPLCAGRFTLMLLHSLAA